ncbi:hypothetical protein T439DRAFT_1220 [Meredithblackwellia eburnea MCA 4105]
MATGPGGYGLGRPSAPAILDRLGIIPPPQHMHHQHQLNQHQPHFQQQQPLPSNETVKDDMEDDEANQDNTTETATQPPSKTKHKRSRKGCVVRLSPSSFPQNRP